METQDWGIQENFIKQELSLYYHINRNLFPEEREQILYLEKEESIRIIRKDKFLLMMEESLNRSGNEDKGFLTKCICVSDDYDVLRHAKNAGWAVIVCRDTFLKEQEINGKDASFVHYAVESLSAIDRGYLETVYCRCKGIPRLIVVTDRLLIREMTLSDLDDLMEIFDSNEKTEFFEPFYDNREEAEQYLASYIRDVYRFYDYGIWGIYLKISGKMIGIAGFTPREGNSPKVVLELGYAVAKGFQGQGYAMEARRAVIGYAEEKLEYERIIEVTGRESKG